MGTPTNPSCRAQTLSQEPVGGSACAVTSEQTTATLRTPLSGGQAHVFVTSQPPAASHDVAGTRPFGLRTSHVDFSSTPRPGLDLQDSRRRPVPLSALTESLGDQSVQVSGKRGTKREPGFLPAARTVDAGAGGSEPRGHRWARPPSRESPARSRSRSRRTWQLQASRGPSGEHLTLGAVSFLGKGPRKRGGPKPSLHSLMRLISKSSVSVHPCVTSHSRLCHITSRHVTGHYTVIFDVDVFKKIKGETKINVIPSAAVERRKGWLSAVSTPRNGTGSCWRCSDGLGTTGRASAHTAHCPGHRGTTATEGGSGSQAARPSGF